LRGPGELAESVSHEDTARNLFPKQISRMRSYGRDTRADVFATNDGCVPDGNAGDIGNRVKRSGWQNSNFQS